MSRLLDGLDELLNDTFFDELMSLDIDEDDCSPTLNQFLGIQSEKDYDISLNEVYIKELEVKRSNIYSDMWCYFFSLLMSYLLVYRDNLIKYTGENDELLNRYKKSLKVLG